MFNSQLKNGLKKEVDFLQVSGKYVFKDFKTRAISTTPDSMAVGGSLRKNITLYTIYFCQISLSPHNFSSHCA